VQYQKTCLITHADPRLDHYATEAGAFFQSHQPWRLRHRPLTYQTQIKELLDQGYPIILGVEFFYAAWNHREMPEIGLGERDMKAWYAGRVGIPTALDIQISRQHAAGHSLVVVGYDDAKQVYYFKNSWGTDSFGKDSDFLGKGTTAGYGTIPYQYAHYYGNFQDVFMIDDYGAPIRKPIE
jgi:hypothetical protein